MIVGDFNQRIPRSRAPLLAAGALQKALQGFEVPTAGEVPPVNRQVIDHEAHDRSLAALGVIAWPGIRADGLYMSDHDGVGVELGSRPEEG